MSTEQKITKAYDGFIARGFSRISALAATIELTIAEGKDAGFEAELLDYVPAIVTRTVTLHIRAAVK